jgi:diguanylate cyclase (GGDEF)-like protein
MTTVSAVSKASNRPDPEVLHRVASASCICLAVAAVIAATVLGGWLVPARGAGGPTGGGGMKANTALSLLLCAAGLALTKPTRRSRVRLAGRVCGGIAMVVAGAALVEHWGGFISGLGTLLAADPGSAMPGRMSIQTASFLVLLGSSMLIGRTRQGALGHTLDIIIAAFTMLAMTLVAGYVFRAGGLIGQTSTIRTSPHTLVCLALLAFVQASRRAPYGYFSVLVGVGIGSRFARLALPVSQVLVLAFIAVGANMLAAGYLTLPYAAGLTAASLAMVLCLFINLVARRTNDLERELREMSYGDDLTGPHNRRSFYLLGEQAMRIARRDGAPLTVFFFDADGLKQVNDTLGHDVGSELLRDIATLLATTFRSSDVVGRLGGDEFAVVAHGPEAESASALRRLEEATRAANAAGDKPYLLSFSTGGATTEPPGEEAFADLVDRADAAMYLHKQQRRAARGASVSPGGSLRLTSTPEVAAGR